MHAFRLGQPFDIDDPLLCDERTAGCMPHRSTLLTRFWCFLLLLGGGGTLLGVLPACGRAEPSGGPARSSAVASGASAEPSLSSVLAAPLPDTRLSNAIRQAIQRDPELGSQEIRASVANGDVTLGGTVPTLSAKNRAAQLVSRFKGVSALTNGLVVTAPARSDAEIKKAVSTAIQRDAATRTAKVQVTSEAGAVSLRGSADSPTQRDLLAEVASRVSGVGQVNLAVDLSQGSPRGDAEMAAEVRDRIHDDARLDGTRIAVEVKGQSVAVSGVVGSLAQRDAAVEDAWAARVANVDSQALRVDWRDNERGRTEPRGPPADGHIADAVRRALSSDARVGIQQPTVVVDRGVVTLSGTVMDFRAVKAADRDTRQIFGVGGVDNRLTVGPAMRESDATIEQQVEGSVYHDIANPDARNVEVMTTNAKVTLRGPVASPMEKTTIEGDVEEVPGVVAVQDDLQVAGYGPQTHIVAAKSIQDRVTEAVFWDPRIEPSKITVDVAPNGDATLTGVVGSWGEAQAARDDAIDAGASHVINRIRAPGSPQSQRL
jgi:osmotically-inducible protein OsmY